MGFFSGKKDLRKEAGALGFIITEVERDLPIITGDGQLDSLDRDKCMRYALPRPKGTVFQLLQRDKKQAQLPNFYQLVADNITPQLLDACRPVAEQFDTGLFEFEGTANEVAVFWDEDGGMDDLPRIQQALQQLQEA